MLEDANTYQRIREVFLENYPQATEILHGGARGVDQLASRLVKDLQLKETIIEPDYAKYPPKVAPLIRNAELVQAADAVLVVYGPKGKKGGTWDTAQKAIKLNKRLIELLPNGNTQEHQPQLTLF